MAIEDVNVPRSQHGVVPQTGVGQQKEDTFADRLIRLRENDQLMRMTREEIGASGGKPAEDYAASIVKASLEQLNNANKRADETIKQKEEAAAWSVQSKSRNFLRRRKPAMLDSPAWWF